MMKAAKTYLCVLTLIGIAPISMAQSVNVPILGNIKIGKLLSGNASDPPASPSSGQRAGTRNSPPVEISQGNPLQGGGEGSKVVAEAQQTAPNRAATGAEFASDFRGNVVYKGTYAGTVTNSSRKGSQSQPVEGAFKLTITVDGAAVNARVESTGNLRFGALSGVVSNGVCKLYERKDPVPLEGQCDLKQFSATTSYSNGNKTGQFHLDGTVVSVEDFAARDAQRAAQAEEARKQAAAARAEELAARSKMRAALPAGAVAKYKPLLAQAVIADAAHWFSNRYADGSIDLVGIHNDAPSGATFLKAYFQYVDGREGWVGAVVERGKVQCLQFWDDSSGCRGIGNGANAKMAAGFLSGMMRSGVTSSTGECNEDCQAEHNIRSSAKDSARQQAEADARMSAAAEAQRRAIENRDEIGR